MMNNSVDMTSGLAFIRDWVADHPPPQPRSAAFRAYLAELVAAADTEGVALAAPSGDMRRRPANAAEGSSTGTTHLDFHLVGIGIQVAMAMTALNIARVANDN